MDWIRLFKKKEQKPIKPLFEITNRSNVIQYDDMGYPLRLVIIDDKEQIWIDSYEGDGDVVLEWKGKCKHGV